MKKTAYRTEIKHIITIMDAQLVRSRVQSVLQLDSHAGRDKKYFIRSLYFDTAEDKAYYEKIDGVAIRDKFRIRYYDHNTDIIRLEKKSKVNGSASKEGAFLKKHQVEAILNGDIAFLLQSSEPICREFFLKLREDRLMPKTTVDYYREAYTCRWGNVRVTLDSDLRTSIGCVDFFNPASISTFPMNPNFCILEIKYDHYLPDFIRDLVQLNTCMATAVSKYVACRNIQLN